MLGGFGALGIAAGMPLCPFALLTGIPCPGCGLGRATASLMTGHLQEALRFHPLVLVVLPGLGLAAYRTLLRREAIRSAWLAVASGSLLVLLLGVWVARFGGALGGPVPVRTLWAAR